MRSDSVFRIAPRGGSSARAVIDAIDAMGGKAFDLSRMARLGLPVPPAFVLGTGHCRQWYLEPERYRKSLPALLQEQMHWLQTVTGLGFGDSRRPLLVSVRSGAPLSMPGMMDTLLNIGLCDVTSRGLLRMTGNPRQVWDLYRRLVSSFAEVVFGADPAPFRAARDEMLARNKVDRVRELDYQALFELAQGYLRLCEELTGRPFPQNPVNQLELAVQAVFASWNSARAAAYRSLYGIPDDIYTAATVQSMVFGNTGGTSGSGVGFTRDPDTGDKRLYFDFLFNSQGEDVVSGRATGSDAEELFSALPEMRRELCSVCDTLEAEFRDAQEFEFTIQDGALHLLQTRTAKRTPWAALKIAVDQVKEGLISKEEALVRLEGLDLTGIKRHRLAGEDTPFCIGESAGIGVAVGPAALDLESARKFSEEGRPAVLIRDELNTADLVAISFCAGVLTARGNRTSHAAVVARQLGKPCVTGAGGLRLDPGQQSVECGNRSISPGAMITLDSNTGRVYEGERELIVEYPAQWLEEIGTWRR
ncbi:MAG: hypothetical protein A2075_03265 [Geobacteraceae bacterium GWC2_58_44]|nr:MAG: hypothetical protein A2075_03265 [Geobacteraceae bacterium GWC2_58_44]HBG05811.1 pyruvate, phosphate dikinase [Geobacter sp.]